MSNTKPKIHPLTYIHPNAKIGKNVSIDPFTVIQDDVEIGENTWIASNVTIMSGTRIGNNCRIFPGTVISAIPQDLKYEGEYSNVIIGNNCNIRECVTINRGTKALGYTKMGDNCLIMATVHIAHDCVLGNNVILVNGVALAGHITIDDFAILGGGTLVHQFCRIGRHAFISGGSQVGKDVPPYVKAARNPLSYLGINSTGLRRRGFANEKIIELQNIYRILFQKNKNISLALAVIEAELPATTERDEIISFIRESKRGLMKGYSPRISNEF